MAATEARSDFEEIKISVNHMGQGIVSVGGKDISESVRAITVHLEAGHLAKVEVTLIGAIDFHGYADATSLADQFRGANAGGSE